jgi:hypothetical protein
MDLLFLVCRLNIIVCQFTIDAAERVWLLPMIPVHVAASAFICYLLIVNELRNRFFFLEFGVWGFGLLGLGLGVWGLGFGGWGLGSGL